MAVHGRAWGGSPHLGPEPWFWWEGEALLVFSKPGARKVRNLRANPSVMLALGNAEDDFDVGLIEGEAELLDRPSAKVLPAAHLDKYADQLATLGPTAAEYAATYSQVIRVAPKDFPACTVTRRRGVHGWSARRPPRSRNRRPDDRVSLAGSASPSAAGCAGSVVAGCDRRPSGRSEPNARGLGPTDSSVPGASVDERHLHDVLREEPDLQFMAP